MLDRSALVHYFWATLTTLLGDRLTVGLQTLTLPVGVRIPVPQPFSFFPSQSLPQNCCFPLFGVCYTVSDAFRNPRRTLMGEPRRHMPNRNMR